ncbi:MAG: hypothetical protein JJU21_00605 [Salinarimonas sp.]|nr:hypothetical protein [Salinarimonas sp.]
MVYRTLKAALFIGLLTLAAGQYAYNAADRATLERMARGEDPLVTGSINSTSRSQAGSQSFSDLPNAANAVRLDPCTDTPR